MEVVERRWRSTTSLSTRAGEATDPRVWPREEGGGVKERVRAANGAHPCCTGHALAWGEDDQPNQAKHWLRSKGNSIEGGTSEIQLNIIARRVLGLPA